MKAQNVFNYPLFALGFRAFFTLAGLSALILPIILNAFGKSGWPADHYYPGHYWHAHEMLLGYAGAVIAGFLLTAIKNWTGKPTLSGDPLGWLCLLWLYGRIMPFYAGLLPDVMIALVDFAFLPILAYYASKPIIESKNYPNLIFIGFLLVLSLGNALVHGQALGVWGNSAQAGIAVVLAAIILLILVIAGRVFPFFTERGLSGTLIIRNPLADNLALATAAALFIGQLFAAPEAIVATLAIAAAVANLYRLSIWYVGRIWYVPLLWVLYLGYAWIILGFILSACAAYNWIQPSLAVHAYTVGGIGVLTLGMMARVSLGHTGRALKVSNAIAIAFVLINLAVLFRVLFPAAWLGWYAGFVYVSLLCWLAAFALFTFVYAPILTAPRIDNQEG